MNALMPNRQMKTTNHNVESTKVSIRVGEVCHFFFPLAPLRRDFALQFAVMMLEPVDGSSVALIRGACCQRLSL